MVMMVGQMNPQAQARARVMGGQAPVGVAPNPLPLATNAVGQPEIPTIGGTPVQPTIATHPQIQATANWFKTQASPRVQQMAIWLKNNPNSPNSGQIKQMLVQQMQQEGFRG